MNEFKLALKFARRELRGGLKGFRVFFLCLLLGAGAISGVETLSSAFLGSLRDQGQTILGGDVSVSGLCRRPTSRRGARTKVRPRCSRHQASQSRLLL